MKKKLYLIMAVSSLMLSCSSSDVEEGETKVVNLLADPQPIQLTEEQRVFAQDNNRFTLNFLKTVNETDISNKSFIYSPLSITYVLGMVNDAATGQTEQELEQTLGFHEGGIQAVNDYCKKLIEGLPKVDSKVTLNMANAIFLNKKYTLKPKFEQDMQTYYDAKAEALDFSSPSSLSHINGWCNNKTNGMIPTILDKVDPDMISYLLNAIYFKANWTSKFDPKNTKNESFTPDWGFEVALYQHEPIQLPMMHQNVLIQHARMYDYSAVRMPYGNGEWSMTIMLPNEGKTTDDIIEHLAQAGINELDGAIAICGNSSTEENKLHTFTPYEVDLKLPRFDTLSDTDELPTEKGLVGLMKKMGIQLAFDEQLAEIPNMCNLPVYINMMRQKAKIKVNEEGSEATVVTVAGMGNDASPGGRETPKATFHVNRPFVYVIREASSGVILFVGKFTGR